MCQRPHTFLGEEGDSEERDMDLPSQGNLGAKFSETTFPHFKTYCKTPKITPSDSFVMTKKSHLL